MEEEKDEEVMHISKVSTLIKSKEHFHKACVANDFFMPDGKASICTMDFLKDVRAKNCWVPKLSEMSFRACVYPPTN